MMTQLTLLTNITTRKQALAMSKTLSRQRLASLTTKQRFYVTSASTVPKVQGWDEAKPLKEMPTTTPWEFLSGFLPGGKFYKKDVSDFVKVLHKEKGDILLIPGFFGKADMVMTQVPDDIENVFRHEGAWPLRKGFEVLTYHRKVHRKDFFGDISGLVTSQGEEWFKFRTAVNPIVIHPKNIKIYLPTLAKVNQEFIERIKAIRDPNTLEMPINFQEEISRWTLDSVSVVALDKQLGLISGNDPIGKRFFDNLQAFFDLSMKLEFQPSLWRHLPNRKLNRVMAALDDSVDIIEKYVNEAIYRIESTTVEKPDAEQSVLEKLLKIDKQIAMVMAMDMLFAGVDTTTGTFAGALLCLAKNPEKQQKLREEILHILPKKDSPLTVENMKNMPYLRACIKEGLRVYPLSIANARTLQSDIVLSGYRIPKGTELGLMSVNLNVNSKHYSRPTEFLPERWLRQSKVEFDVGADETCPHAEAAATKSSHPFAYLPFGFGVRSCIGRRIAEMELEIGLARIVRNFHVEFNHPTENAFKCMMINTPNIPLKFKFSDIDD